MLDHDRQPKRTLVGWRLTAIFDHAERLRGLGTTAACELRWQGRLCVGHVVCIGLVTILCAARACL